MKFQITNNKTQITPTIRRQGETERKEVMKLGSWEKGIIMSNDKLQMSNQCQITNAKLSTKIEHGKTLRCPN